MLGQDSRRDQVLKASSTAGDDMDWVFVSPPPNSNVEILTPTWWLKEVEPLGGN